MTERVHTLNDLISVLKEYQKQHGDKNIHYVDLSCFSSKQDIRDSINISLKNYSEDEVEEWLTITG